MSLGMRNTTVHTCIGTKNEVIEEVKISLFDIKGIIQNVQTQVTDKPISPDRLKSNIWYTTAFEKLGIPENMRHIFDEN